MSRTEASVGRLTVCPTPIGNLDDVTLRVLAALRDADVIACEDTRRTRVLLERHGIPGRTVSLHEHNERTRSRELIERIRAGAMVALVSDAGTPVLSDPGFTLLHDCLQAGLELEVLPGPSAITTALVSSGLAPERWRFVGFLPRARGELREVFASATDTLVAFESPRRLAGTLELLAELDPERPAAVCRELTKLHEEVRRDRAGVLAEHYRGRSVRGEVVLVCAAVRAGGSGRTAAGDAVGALRELVEAGAKARPAATALARLTGVRANELYRELAGGREGSPHEGSGEGDEGPGGGS